MAGRIESLQRMLDAGHDSAVLRFSLGTEYAAQDDFENAAKHLAHCIELDRGYSAAWKLLGKSLTKLGRLKEAADAWSKGIDVAKKKGDRQAAKEMTVFLRRLQKQQAGDEQKPQGEE